MPLRIACLFLIAALSLTPRSQAQEVLSVSLQQAIQMALQKNFRIKVEEFGPQIAKARQKSASGKFDPVLSFSYTRSENNQELRTLNAQLLEETGIPGNPTPLLFARTQGNEIDASIAGLTPWGLTYDIGPSLIFDNDNRRDPGYTRYNSFFGINATQPLLRNFGTDVNLASIRIARVDRAVSQWQLRNEVINVVTDCIRVYSELCFAIENLAVERRSRALAEQLVKDNTKRAEIGVMAPLDVLQAKTDLAAREERVLVAEREVADTENFLKQLITDEISTVLATTVQVSPPQLPEIPRVDRQKDFPRAFELRPDYRQALLDIQRRQINVVFTRNQALPQLDLTASFGVNGIDSSFASSFERVTGNANNNFAWNAGALFSVPIPNRTATGNLDAARLETAQALVGLKRIEQSILVEADNAAGHIETTRKRIEASKLARDFAARTLDAAQTRLASGTTTTFEVLQFQRDLATAEVNELRARADFIIALAEYARLTGSTLERNHINFD